MLKLLNAISPAPARPKTVSVCPPRPLANLAVSARPLVSIAALAFSPSSSPYTIPAAIAITFFIAPETDVPIISFDPYTLNSGE